MTEDAIALPAVTVIVACYNHAPYVRQALDSIFGQTHPDVRVLITDDASTDDTADVIRGYLSEHGYAATFIHHTINRGQCPTLNEAVAQVTTEFVAITAGDDWSELDRFERSVQLLDSLGDDYGAVYADVFIADMEGVREPGSRAAGRPMPSGEILVNLVTQNVIPATTVTMRTAALRAVGGYDESLPVEDYDLWLRMAAKYRIAFIQEPLATFRTVQGSLTDAVGSLYFRQARLHSLPKHLGIRPDIDAAIVKRLWVNARFLYFKGVPPAELSEAFGIVARRDRRPITIFWWVCALLRLPEPVMSRLISLRGRTGKFHEDLER